MIDRVPTGTMCPKCEKGLMVFPNEHWKNVLKTLRCNHCFETARPVLDAKQVEVVDGR